MGAIRGIFGEDFHAVFEILGKKRPKADAVGNLETDDTAMRDSRSGAEKGERTDLAWRDLVEPEEAIREYMTAEDDIIRKTDEPERVFMRYRNRSPETLSEAALQREAQWIAGRLINSVDDGPGNNFGPLYLTEKIVKQAYEREFGISRLTDGGDRPTMFYPYDKTTRQDVEEKVYLVLDMMLAKRYEVPFILYHHHSQVCPPLNDLMIWKIWELDLEWWRLSVQWTTLMNAVMTSHSGSVPSKIRVALEKFETQEDLDDVRAYLTTHLRSTFGNVTDLAGSSQLTKGDFGEESQAPPEPQSQPVLIKGEDGGVIRVEPRAVTSEEAPTLPTGSPTPETAGQASQPVNQTDGAQPHQSPNGDDQSSKTTGRPKRRAPLKRRPQRIADSRLLYQRAEATGQVHNWALLKCEEMEENVEVSRTSLIRGSGGINFAHAPPYGPQNPKDEFFPSLIMEPQFSTVQTVIDGIVEYESKRLASMPTIRSTLRAHFMQRCCVTTVTTARGESLVDPTKDNWLSMRTFRRPINTFWSTGRDPLSCTLCLPLLQSVHHYDKKEFPNRSDPLFNYQQSVSRIREDVENLKNCELFGQMLKHEQSHCIDIVIHPLCPRDSRPWAKFNRDTNDIEWLSHFQNRSARGEEAKKAEQEALEKSDVSDIDIYTHLVNMLKDLYACPDSRGNPSQEYWRSFQASVIDRMIEKELFPIFRKEARELLTKRSEAYILSRCEESLRTRLMVRPFKRDQGFVEFDDDEIDEEDEADIDSSRAGGDLDDGDDDEDGWAEGRGGGGRRTPAASRAGRRTAVTAQRGGRGTRHEDDQSFHETPKVVSLIIEPAENGLRIHASSIDRNAQLINQATFGFILDVWVKACPFLDPRKPPPQLPDEPRFRRDFESLVSFLRLFENRPDVIAVGMTDPSAIALVALLENHVIARLRSKYTYDILFVPVDAARVWLVSDKCPAELQKTATRDALIGLSCGRLLQDPLSELLNLWNEQPRYNGLLHLQHHPLQNLMGQDKLHAVLTRAAVQVVAHVGVDLSKVEAGREKHTLSALPLVPGLGPRKAAELVEKIGAVNRITFRRQLLDADATTSTPISPTGASTRSYLTKEVYTNAVAFLRMGESYEDDERMDDLLDSTRIHPILGYQWATKICRDAQEEPRAEKDPVAETFKHPEKVDELDLQTYSEILAKKGQKRTLPDLQFIVSEIKSPYRDLRVDFPSNTNPQDLFFAVTQLNPKDFRKGTEVTARVTFVNANIGIVRLMVQPFNVRGVLKDPISYAEDLQKDPMRRTILQAADGSGNARDQQAPVPVEAILTPNTVIQGRVAAIHFDTMEVSVVASKQEQQRLLENRKDEVVGPSTNRDHHGYRDRDSHAFESLMQHDVNQEKIRKQERGRGQQRSIAHNRFHAVSHGQMEAMLRDSPFGVAMFRPSSEGIDTLVMHLTTLPRPPQLCNKIVTIREKNQRIPGELGRELYIDGKLFSALDHILNEYVGELKERLLELHKHKKFIFKPKADAIAELKALESSKVAYCMVPNVEVACRFHLLQVLPRSDMSSEQPLFQDTIIVDVDGFHLWNRTEAHIQELLHWWKREGFIRRVALRQTYHNTKLTEQRQREEEKQKERQEAEAAASAVLVDMTFGSGRGRGGGGGGDSFRGGRRGGRGGMMGQF
eukprot:GHVN01074259.1.p1 GENE.GHVN01074259.1~~GHVN01074259.1.p1  ORF type:complete len:1821 (+),score=338.49 GHVN01074259.1:495-5465(+)